jgi:hypothetical protein
MRVVHLPLPNTALIDQGLAHARAAARVLAALRSVPAARTLIARHLRNGLFRETAAASAFSLLTGAVTVSPAEADYPNCG